MKADFVFPLENARWPVLVLSQSGVICRANSAAVEIFSAVTETGRLSAASIWAPENESTVEVFLSRAENSISEALPLKLRVKSGQIVAFSAYLSPFSKDGQKQFLLQLLKEGTQAKSRSAEPPKPSALQTASESSTREGAVLESANAQKQKLECALQLTRTVALDFNNALTSILGHTSLVLGRMESGHPWHSSLVEIEKAAEKAAEIAADLAAFSRQEKDARSQVAGNLNELVRRTVKLFQGQDSKKLAWELELEPRLFTATFDEAKVQQAFNKILENAILASADGGQIFLRTRNYEVTDGSDEDGLRLPRGHYVCIEFEDHGCGIAPELLPRIFEPFFTTKNSPRHRGLGLAWVYGIITNHGGRVSVTSQPDQGATFRLYLPAERKIVHDRGVPADDMHGTETILLVDDEELLLTMGEMVLSSFGYRVILANNGRKALDLFKDNAEGIDLVITDLVMPQMSGRQLVEALRRLSPHVKIICSSGYTRASNAENDEFYLQKPFTSLDLLRKVKQALTASEVP